MWAFSHQLVAADLFKDRREEVITITFLEEKRREKEKQQPIQV